MTQDLEFTCANTDSIARFNRVIASYLGARADVPDLLTALLEDDPAMPMAVCLQGYLLKLAAHPKFKASLDELLTRANDLDACNLREALHIQALGAWADNRDGEALDILEQILSDHPGDMCALRIAHYLHFYRGIGAEMAASTARVQSAYTDNDEFAGFFLGMHAFGLEESGQLAEAEALGRRAAEINPADLWAVHAVDHALYTQGEHTQGIDWLWTHEPHWEETNNFHYHLYWHIALHHLMLGEPDKALSLYDEKLEQSLADDFYLDVCNNAALLWRLEHRGVDVGDRWQAVRDIAENHTTDQELVFASLHYLLALQRTRSPETANLQRNFRAWAKRTGDQAEVSRAIAVPLLESLNEGIESNWLAHIHEVGGSRAQRELFGELQPPT